MLGDSCLICSCVVLALLIGTSIFSFNLREMLWSWLLVSYFTDVKELISLLASRLSEGCKCDADHLLDKCSCQSSFGLPRPSRVKAMLASESCKLSVKVGYALGMKEMEEVRRWCHFYYVNYEKWFWRVPGFYFLNNMCPSTSLYIRQVVSHLAELEAPWTCPHGRPTIRHVVDLSLGLKLTADSAHGWLIAF